MGEPKTHKVILYNDDKLSFEYITACLIKICGHTPIQAEQCAILAHNRGHIDVASGSFNKMYEILETLDYVKVEASLETYESNLY